MDTRAALAVAAAIVAAQSAGADTLRCGGRLISEEDSIEKVLQYCGEPVAKKRTWIARQPRFEYGGQEIPFVGSEDVAVDLWTYDFGANKLMRQIRFVGGKVESIETLAHGTNR